MESITPFLEDERMGLDVLSLTFEADVALLSALGNLCNKKGPALAIMSEIKGYV